MSDSNLKLAKISGNAFLVLGVLLVITDLVYLPVAPAVAEAMAQMGQQMDGLGLVMYSFATAGGAFAAWGYMLAKTDGSGVSKAIVFKATAIGLFLMGLMRLVTAVFPPDMLAAALPVLLGEGFGFIALAIVFLKKGKE